MAHEGLAPVLDAVRAGGVAGISEAAADLAAYRKTLHDVDPDTLSRPEALAYWINLYNAEALDAAAEAFDEGLGSMLRLPGAFDRPRARVAGEHLSLDDIEHGKVRRFQDPRIHGALVCGSVSCPTLRFEPFTGDRVEAQLEAQMRAFLAAGGAVANRPEGELGLSRVLLWYGADFTRPTRMPTIFPARPRRIAAAVTRWLEPEDAEWVRTTSPAVTFQRYDWALGCSIR